MLIISKKKDYYDGVVGTTGIDKTIIYNRDIIEVEENDIPLFLKRKSYAYQNRKDSPFLNLAYYKINKEYKKNFSHYGHFIIGFCGKMYIGWKLYNEAWDGSLITEISYDAEYMKEALVNDTYWGKLDENIDKILKYDNVQLFRDLNAPYFVYDGDYNRVSIPKYYHRNKEQFIINPLLKDYEFYKVFNTFQAFQEIQMFMGGVLGSKEKEIVQIEDKYKIAQHGFDKWSFRKEPKNGK
jgi:hypothetical protein